MRQCLRRFFPAMTEADLLEFRYAFFPFLFGVYPYTNATEKQKAAMALAAVEGPSCTIYSITKSLTEKLLRPFER